jgi:hypothetical protein
MFLRRELIITTAAVCSLAVSAASARPALRVGLGVVAEIGEPSYDSYYDSAGVELGRVTRQDPWAGPAFELEYGPVWAFRFRSELAQLRFMYAGGGALTMPGLGLDLMAEPPFPWRLKPYVWVGGQWALYWGDQGHFDVRFEHKRVYNLGAGLGGRFVLSDRLEVVAEVEFWRHDMYGPMVDLRWIDEGVLGLGYLHDEALGLNRARLGVRLPLGS